MEQLDRHSSGMKTTLKTFVEKLCNLISLEYAQNNIFDGFESTPPLIWYKGITDSKEGAALKRSHVMPLMQHTLFVTGEQHVNRKAEGKGVGR